VYYTYQGIPQGVYYTHQGIPPRVYMEHFSYPGCTWSTSHTSGCTMPTGVPQSVYYAHRCTSGCLPCTVGTSGCLPCTAGTSGCVYASCVPPGVYMPPVYLRVGIPAVYLRVGIPAVYLRVWENGACSTFGFGRMVPVLTSRI